ncbi:MAG: short-chain fatty acyl-CoA regulator family protein [Planctomycetota bacterium]|jgi:predicted transcriptional regulator/transcriptional regulator with XRE-family HTH domain|nr:short-chain fatty acyl-CoA regulator family protein [Planctomycetota bacterium]
MTRRQRLGHRVRKERLGRGMTQAQMAEALGISPSYLNLLEHDKRPLTVALLLKLAQTFGMDLQSLAEDDGNRLIQDLTEVFGDSLFEQGAPAPSAVEDLVGVSPEVSRAVIALYRAYRACVSDRTVLAEQLAGSEWVEGSLGPPRLPTEEVSDLIQDCQNHFPELELAAQQLRTDADAQSESLDRGLMAQLVEKHGVDVSIIPADEAGAAVRKFDPQRGRLVLSEVLPPRSRSFQLAHQIALIEHRPVLDGYLALGNLSTEDSRTLGRVALANYFAGAVLMPYTPFLQAARTMRYDVEMLGHRFRTSFEQVCQRLTTLSRPGESGVPLHMVRVDIAGNISKHFSASGIRFARFSGACPRWNVHAAFMQPGFIRTQLSRMPDGTTYFCIARTVRKEGGGFRAPQSRLAIGLGCEVSHAKELVYADGVDLGNLEAAEPIGPTCRLCDRMDCRQRAFPPIRSRLGMDENVRGLSFYVEPAPGAPGYVPPR